MSEIDFQTAGQAHHEGGVDAASADARERPGDEDKGDLHVSAFPMSVGAAAQDRAATSAGRGWRGDADDGSDGASLEQHLHACEVAKDRMPLPASRLAVRIDRDGRAHAALAGGARKSPGTVTPWISANCANAPR